MPRWGEQYSTGKLSKRDAQQSDVRPRSVNERVLRSDDSLFEYDDDDLTPVGGRGIVADITGDLTGDVTGDLDGRVFSTAVTKTSNYTITDDDGDYIEADPSSGDVTLTLPTAADNTGRTIYVRHTGGTTNNVILDGEGSEQVDGATTMTLEDGGSWVAIRCDGTKWVWIAGKILGSNSNGSYIVFSSGIQVCWGTISATGFSTANFNIGTYGMSIYQAINTGNSFSKDFGSAPRVFMGGANTSGSSMVSMDADTITTTSFRSAVRDNGNLDFVAVAYLAIGEAG